MDAKTSGGMRGAAGSAAAAHCFTLRPSTTESAKRVLPGRPPLAKGKKARATSRGEAVEVSGQEA